MARLPTLLIGLAMLGVSAQHAAYSPVDPPRRGLPNIDFPTRPYLGDASPPDRREGEAALAYALRLSRFVHESSYHCRADELPLSWIERGFAAAARPVFAEGLLVRERFRCGLCSQRAGMLDQLLHERGIASDVLGLEGHVVVLVGDHVVDPDFNVGPFLYSDPKLYALAAAAYSRVRGTDGFDYAAFLVSKGDNELYDRPYMEKMERYQRTVFRIADIAALLLAALGLVLILAAAKNWRRRPAMVEGASSSSA